MKTKIILKSILLLVLILFFGICQAQVLKPKQKEYRRALRQRTRELTKEGYSPKGAGTVELYVKEAINKEFAKDENGDSKFAVVYTSAVDPTFEGAVNACRAAARAALAGNIETRVAELVKRSLNTDQVSMKSADGINKTVTAGKQLIAQKVSMEDTYILFREIKDERDGKTIVEVNYAGAYSQKLAMEKAHEYLREQMKNETEELHKDLDKIFKLD
jgi:RNA 3'-terminal phosphate cyclase